MDLGSWTKDWPDLFPGGREPVTEYFSASIMVVLPHPLMIWNQYRVIVVKSWQFELVLGDNLRYCQ